MGYSASARHRASPSAVRTILLVEDCLTVREKVTQQFKDSGCLLLFAKDKDDAIAVARTHSRPIDFAVINVRENADFVDMLHRYKPSIKVTFSTETNAQPFEIAELIKAVLR